MTFAGWVPDPLAYLRQADVFVLPSLQEASGSLAVVEAFQAGVAVVSSAIDGLTEDLIDAENALLVPPGDAVALAAALGRLLGDAGLRQRRAGRGHDLFRRRFTASLLVEALAQAYADLGVRPAPA